MSGTPEAAGLKHAAQCVSPQTAPMTTPSKHDLRDLESKLAANITRGASNPEATIAANSTLVHDCLALVRHTLKETTT